MPGIEAIRKFAISIHALREEGDPITGFRGWSGAIYFYPRPPRGGRQPKEVAKDG